MLIAGCGGVGLGGLFFLEGGGGEENWQMDLAEILFFFFEGGMFSPWPRRGWIWRFFDFFEFRIEGGLKLAGA